jgi:hypothetical protein
MMLIIFLLHVVDMFVSEPAQYASIIGGPRAGDKGGAFG